MIEITSVEASASANEELRTASVLPDGEYAIVEQLGHRTLIGRIAEVEMFGTKLLQIEAIYADALLPPVMIGGASIYGFTPCSREAAFARQPTNRWQLPASVSVLLPPLALPAPNDDEVDWSVEDPAPPFAPAFLDADVSGGAR